jgi:hypothetical protein
VAAPGYGEKAGLSANESTSNVWKAEDNAHRIRKGTSASAAHVAGGLAILLQDEPDMKPSRARWLLTRAAKADTYTGTVPNGTWGSGKFSLYGPASTGVETSPGAPEEVTPAFPNPARHSVNFEFALGSVDERGTGEVVLRILDVQGREVAAVRGVRRAGPQRLTWSGVSSDGKRAAAGVYVARLDGVSEPADWKFVMLR